MNDFISYESDVESSKATDVLETSAEEEALGSDDAEITPDNKKKIYRGMLFVLIGGASWAHLEPLQSTCLISITLIRCG